MANTKGTPGTATVVQRFNSSGIVMGDLASSHIRSYRFRFSLGLVFVVMALCGMTLSILSYRMHQVRREMRASGQIEKLGGSVIYSTQTHARAWAPESIEPLFQPTVISIDLRGRPTRSEDIEAIGDLKNLQRLNLQGTQIGPEGLLPLRNLKQLKSLSLAHTGINDTDLACLARLKKLKTLSLRDTNISDAGLAHIADLTELESLNLLGTQVTALGLGRLQSLSSLTSLSVEQCCITPRTVVALGHSGKLKQLGICVPTGTGAEAYELLQRLEGSTIKAFLQPDGAVLWNASQAWQDTTGGVVSQIGREADLNEDQIEKLRDVLASRQPDGDWSQFTVIRLGFAGSNGAMTMLTDDLPAATAEALPNGAYGIDQRLGGWFPSEKDREVSSLLRLARTARTQLPDGRNVPLSELVPPLVQLSFDADPRISLDAAYALEQIACGVVDRASNSK